MRLEVFGAPQIVSSFTFCVSHCGHSDNHVGTSAIVLSWCTHLQSVLGLEV